MEFSPESIISILIGIGLAASVGFRIFVPLFALSLASFYNVIPLNESWEWVGSSTAIIILGIALAITSIGSVGFIDDSNEIYSRVINGLKVYSTNNFEDLIKRKKISIAKVNIDDEHIETIDTRATSTGRRVSRVD